MIERIKKRVHVITITAALAAGFTAGQMTAVGPALDGVEETVYDTKSFPQEPQALPPNAFPSKRAAVADALCENAVTASTEKTGVSPGVCGAPQVNGLSLNMQSGDPILTASFFTGLGKVSVSKKLDPTKTLGLRALAANQVCTTPGKRGMSCVTSNVIVLSITWTRETTSGSVKLAYSGTWAHGG